MLFLILVVLLIMGCFIDAITIRIITVPLLSPIIDALGISRLHFGVIHTVVTLLGMSTPPVGTGLLTIFEGNSQETEAALDHAQIDLLIGYPPLSKNSIQSIPFWEEKTVLVIPHQILVRYFPAECGDILSGSRKLCLGDVRHCPVLAMDVETRLGCKFYEACAKQGFVPKVVLKAKSLSVLVPLCLNGLGIMVCPEVFLLPYRNQIGSREDGRVFLFPLSEVFPPKDMCVNYLKSKYLSTTARGFVRIIEQEKAQLAWTLY
ncbi:TRAP transporter large permease subunit [Oscillibacter sp. MSJ-2]|uniref:TRAP transporter large permease subunit n=1 Tax=Dysosmobacter acutus TaxID=2841504 RepID=A0ABS6F629_9FIRM|nr:substrate-binding domain-containing protein [Dysosmobacter acutus]MBU5625490.1 TRAP transporter large permease subunit [Dysosmobacter acutus]